MRKSESRWLKHGNYQLILYPKNGAKTGKRTGRKKRGKPAAFSVGTILRMVEETQ